jgi:hypothetical protein
MEDFERFRSEGMALESVSQRPAVVGTTGRGLRKQRWGALVVATSPNRDGRSVADLASAWTLASALTKPEEQYPYSEQYDEHRHNAENQASH